MWVKWDGFKREKETHRGVENLGGNVNILNFFSSTPCITRFCEDKGRGARIGKIIKKGGISRRTTAKCGGKKIKFYPSPHTTIAGSKSLFAC